jgi:hypothetical protein
MSAESDSAAWYRRDNAWRERLRIQREWLDRQAEIEREARALERSTASRAELTLDALIDAIGKRVDPDATGWDGAKRRRYAEHLVQPWCTCEPESNDMGDPPWDLCAHARDEGF